MALDVQYNLYSVDTGHFYSNHERYLHNINHKYRQERNYLNNKLTTLENELLESGYSNADIKKLKNNKLNEISYVKLNDDKIDKLISDYLFTLELIVHKRNKAKQSKEKLSTLLKNKVNQNEKTDGKDHIRVLSEKYLNDNNIVSIFTSALSRTIGINQDELTDALLIVQIYYFDIFKDIAFYGFMYKGEKYRYFTSSAGQIRKKKAVFIKESIWNQIEKTIMCGLTIDTINEKGGNNVNKHLAYLALTNSATDEWVNFDIDKSIVIDDFETDVYDTFDFIDETDYSITRKTDYVPVPHTDGAGMILPLVSKKNFMVRTPWIKGLLSPFDFKKFIEINNCSSIIKDIYGQEHDVIAEDIQVIFTKSQFKMWKYYSDWNEYKQYFKQYNCHAGICNVEEDRIKNAKINYQMLQTLTNITDEEIDIIAQKSVDKITNVCTSKENMLDVLGVTPYNNKMTYFQKSLKIYPQLLNDTYAKDILRDVKNSLLKKYRSGKLEVDGKYLFVLPDFYAACEYWFKHENQPKGLLNNGEVFSWIYRKYDKLDCLRSPHLYKEHAVRFNIANNAYGDRNQEIREWFNTDGIYTSTHDLISKILMLDVDGDKLLVVSDPKFVNIAERNINGIVPLYYNMRKAEPTELNNKTIYEGLNLAFTHGNIGIYSNNISKIWNSDVFINGSEKEQQEAIDVVKLLCAENNFQIDSAKTLYFLERPKWFNTLLSKYTNKKLPAFFEFAKDKEKSQVEKRNDSFVNKLFDKIPNKPINTRRLKLGDINYKDMMANKNIVCSTEVAELHNKLNQKYRYTLNMKDEHLNNLRYIACQIRGKFNELGYSDEMISDMLVEYLYGHNKRYKQLLWFCYGQYIYTNLLKVSDSISTKFVQCIDCGEWFEVDKSSRRKRCTQCTELHRREHNKKMYQNRQK